MSGGQTLKKPRQRRKKRPLMAESGLCTAQSDVCFGALSGQRPFKTLLPQCPLPGVKRTSSVPILGVSGLMSAFLQSGRSETAKTVEIRVRFRPKTAVLSTSSPLLFRCLSTTHAWPETSALNRAHVVWRNTPREEVLQDKPCA